MSVLPLDVEINVDEPLRCPGCSIGTDDDYDAIYITAFIPGTGKTKVTVPACGACAVEIRNRAQKGAEHLEDRALGAVSGQNQGQGLAPAPPSAADVWKALGIQPRE